ncbi:hypothetical protein J4U02_gp067 [Mycobacterium phage Aziz]|uniref:Uncharacterized protein n=1 Tax=Mycobacterium phage Aziz TaxID=2762281 RepID=A0A7G8LHK5_9CAUD|nr:hypothetical protein J4U02_gp067 [Mycobacterium phage Aziz]ASR75914.1 hypothetical protein SEA_GENEVAB15_68 [Mycobacterium phage GenevaB15]QNJ56727.1 hypothetical protein SEA_AZIZ_67 [Mycobacterium phage Aziz]
MADYPKDVRVNTADPRLWTTGLVEINISAIVPEAQLLPLLNRIGEIL